MPRAAHEREIPDAAETAEETAPAVIDIGDIEDLVRPAPPAGHVHTEPEAGSSRTIQPADFGKPAPLPRETPVELGTQW